MSNQKVTITVQLTSLQQQQFTGRLDIKSTTGKYWKLYFFLGRLVWSDGGEHPHRSWQRHLTKYCPQIDLSTICIKDLDQFECQNYQILTKLIQRDLVKPEQAKALVESKVAEVLFDIMQQQTIDPLQCTHQPASSDPILASALKTAPALINVEYALQQTEKDWAFWMHNGLMSCSLDLAPTLKQPEKLRQEVSENVYQNFVKWLDGNSSLRDLGFNLNKDVLKLTYSLVPFIHKGLLELVEIPDRDSAIIVIKSPTNSSESPGLTDANSSLIACVDDSPQICAIMEQILTKAGYRFIGVREPLQAVPKLVSSHPDLIFLDIGMPVINGYEICTQLRRVSKFKETPIVMLTGHDGLVDRVRAKVAGASEFVPKPIDVEKIIKTVEKFLSVARTQKSSQAIAGTNKINSKLNPV